MCCWNRTLSLVLKHVPAQILVDWISGLHNVKLTMLIMNIS